MAQQHENSKTIFAVSKHPEKIDKVMKLIAEKMHGFSEPNSGMMFVVPVLKAVGIGKKKLHKMNNFQALFGGLADAR